MVPFIMAYSLPEMDALINNFVYSKLVVLVAL